MMAWKCWNRYFPEDKFGVNTDSFKMRASKKVHKDSLILNPQGASISHWAAADEVLPITETNCLTRAEAYELFFKGALGARIPRRLRFRKKTVRRTAASRRTAAVRRIEAVTRIVTVSWTASSLRFQRKTVRRTATVTRIVTVRWTASSRRSARMPMIPRSWGAQRRRVRRRLSPHQIAQIAARTSPKKQRQRHVDVRQKTKVRIKWEEPVCNRYRYRDLGVIGAGHSKRIRPTCGYKPSAHIFR